MQGEKDWFAMKSLDGETFVTESEQKARKNKEKQASRRSCAVVARRVLARDAWVGSGAAQTTILEPSGALNDDATRQRLGLLVGSAVRTVVRCADRGSRLEP